MLTEISCQQFKFKFPVDHVLFLFSLPIYQLVLLALANKLSYVWMFFPVSLFLVDLISVRESREEEMVKTVKKIIKMQQEFERIGERKSKRNKESQQSIIDNEVKVFKRHWAIRERERERERDTSAKSSYFYLFWLKLICTLFIFVYFNFISSLSLSLVLMEMNFCFFFG